MKPVGLVACCKTKLDRPAPAEELYQGTLFKLSVAWLKPRTDGWAILSAKHFVLLPGDVVEPYERTLVGAHRDDVGYWNRTVNQELREMFPGRRFLVICGKDYEGAFAPGDGLAPLMAEHAFRGLPLGRKLGALKEALRGQAV